MYRVETKAKSRIDKKSLGQMTDYLNLAGLRKHPVITHTLHFRKGRERKVCIKTLLNQHQVNSSAFYHCYNPIQFDTRIVESILKVTS